MTTFNVGDWKNLTVDAITNLLLYGQLTTPKEIFDRIVPSIGPTEVVLDMASFMSNGPGRYALPSLVPFVQLFFGGNLPAALQGITGTYTVQELINNFHVDPSEFRFSFQQRGWEPGASDYGLRTYIYNSESFVLDPNTEFVFGGPNPHIDNLRVLAFNDNFDFNSGSRTTQFGDSVVLRPNIDPYNLADPNHVNRQVIISFSNKQGVAAIQGYNAHRYDSDVDFYNKNYGLITSLGATASATLEAIKQLQKDDVIEYSKDGFPVIYGTARDDALNLNSVRPQGTSLVYGGPSQKDRAVFVGGPGNDTITGGAENDELYGGIGDDTLIGGGGGDYLDGGAGTDTALYKVAGVYKVSPGGAPPKGFDADGSGAFFTVDGVNGVDILHSIETIVLPNLVIKLAAGASSQPGSGYQVAISGNSLVLGTGAGESISLVGTKFAQSGQPSSGNDTSLIAVSGDKTSATGGSGNDILIAAGVNDTLSASQSGQKLIALGQNGDVLSGQTSNALGLDKLIAIKGAYVGSNVLSGGIDTLNSGIGNNIMIGEGVNTTFNVDTTRQGSNAVDVVWASGGNDTLNVTGGATVWVVNAPDATLANVKDLDVQKLYQKLTSYVENVTYVFGTSGPIAPTQGPAVIVINPEGSNEKLFVNGQQIKTGSGGPTVGGDLISVTGMIENLAGPVVGLAPGDFGISVDHPNGTTPQVSLANYQVQASSNVSGGSGGGIDPSVVDQSSISGVDFSDTLLSITSATITVDGARDTLIAANGADTLVDESEFGAEYESQDTLIGNLAGSILYGTTRGTTVAAYTASGLTVNLQKGTASIAGSSARDSLFYIDDAVVTGSNNTLIGSNGTSTLTAIGSGNTLIGGAGATTLVGLANGSQLIAGSGATVASYTNTGFDQNYVVNLASGMATNGGAGPSDTLIGIQVVEISDQYVGTSDTLLGGSGNDTLITDGRYGTLIGGTGNELLTATANSASNTLIAGSGTDTLASTGAGNVLIGGSGNDLLTSTGFSELVAGSGTNTLSSSGFGDALVGNGLGSTLIGAAGKNAEASYALDNVTVDLAGGMAKVNGSSTSDTLINIAVAGANGNNDTLLGGAVATTLNAGGSADTLIGGSGPTVMYGEGSADTLLGGSGTTRMVVGSNDNKAVGGSGATTITNFGSANTLIGGSGSTTFETSVAGNVLVAGPGTTVAVYSDNGDVVNLATGNASLSGSPSDTLVGITMAAVSGAGSTLIGAVAGNVLEAEGSADVLIAGSGVETLTSTGSGNTLVAGGSGDSLSSSGSGDTLIGGSGSDLLSSSGGRNSLIAGSGIDILSSSGSDDTLFGNLAGSTLDGTAGSGAIAAYLVNNVTVDLGAGTAQLNGSSVSDTLRGLGGAAALGANDTLIDGNGGATLMSNANGNTLVGGAGETVAVYALNNLTVDLSAGTARVSSSSLSDILIGIQAASVSGTNDTIVGGSGANFLSATGSDNTLLAGAGNDTLASNGTNNVLIAGSGTDILTSSSGSGNTLLAGAGSDTLMSNGTRDSLVAGSGADILSSGGSNNSLLAGTGVATLTTTGYNDTLFGSGSGSTLNGSSGSGAIAVYSINDVTVDVLAGTAGVNGSGVSDTLVGFSTFAALGRGDTLIDGSQGSTFVSNAAGNTLEGSSGQTVAVYATSDLTVNLSMGTAGVNGSGTSDTLVGIHAATVAGASDTLVGDDSTDVLSSSGIGNTLVAGTGIDTLMTTGAGDTLFGNLLGSTLEETEVWNGQAWQQGTGAIAVYTADNATINLATSNAQLNGASVSDNLWSINTIEALGSNDTLVGSSRVSTLISGAEGNTLIGQVGAETIALYKVDNITVDLAAGRAAVEGAAVGDTLIGIMAAEVTGTNDTLIGTGTGDTLIASNSSDVVAYGRDNLSINLVALAIDTDQAGNSVIAGTAGVNGTNAEDRLVNVTNVLVSGIGDSVTGGMTSDSMTAAGSNETLIAGVGKDVLVATGSNDTLIGNIGGSTLESTGSASGTLLLYTYDGVTIDLGAGEVSSFSSNASDTLMGINRAAVTGAYNTLIAGSGADNLSSSGLFNSLVGGSGADILTSNGQHDALIAGSGSQTLVSHGFANTLIAGSAVDTLTTTGRGDSLVGNALGSTLEASGGAGAIAVYVADNAVVDLRAGTAQISGSNATDTLSGIVNATVSGARDTAIASNSASILTATGASDTLIGGDGADTLLASGTGDTVIAGSGSSVLASSGFANTLLAGAGVDVLSSTGRSDVLRAGSSVDTLSSSGSGNTLVAGSAADTLISTGEDDTLFGNAGGSSLIGTGATGAVAAYAIDNVTVDLSNGTATVNGSGVFDTLVGINSVLLLGSNDTVIGGSGTSTLYSNAAGNTIVAGRGHSVVVYSQDEVTVNLTNSTAAVNGSTASDSLVGVEQVQVTGSGDTLIGGAAADILLSGGSFNTLIAGSGANTLLSSGIGDTLIAGSGSDFLSSSGQGNVLVAGGSGDALSSTGYGDTLIGNAAGSILDGSGGNGTIAAYRIDGITVDLANQTATAIGGADTLVGIAAAMALGSNDTLVGGHAATTLSSNGAGNTLIAGTGQTTAVYTADNVRIDLASGTAAMNGSSTSDTLINITSAASFGTGDTLVGAGSGDALSSGGYGNTLIAGVGAETLSSSGYGDTLIGNAAGSTLDGTNGSGTVAAYAISGINIDLTTEKAGVNGSNSFDKLVGIDRAEALGTSDTLIGGVGATTLYSNGNGNTLISGAGATTAAYNQDNVTVNLGTESAAVNGSSLSDMLVGITAALASGVGDTLIGHTGGDVLNAQGTKDVLLGGDGAETLVSEGMSNTLVAGAGADLLSSSGTGDTLLGGAGKDILVSSGFDNSLVAGSGVNALTSTGDDDTLFGNGAGSTLDGNGGIGVIAAYAADNATINLASGTASLNGSATHDTLIGISAAAALGANGTILGGAGSDTLIAGSGNDVLTGGGGADVYQIGATFGQTQINNDAADGTTTPKGQVDFGTGITDQQLWFVRAGNDLQVDLLGTSDRLTISGWYSDQRAQVQEFTTVGGLKLDNQVAQLVSAMATYGANNPSFDPTMATQMPSDSSLQNAISAAWHT